MCCAHNGIHVVECHIVEGALLWHPAVATCESLTPYTLALRRICLEYPVGNPGIYSRHSASVSRTYYICSLARSEDAASYLDRTRRSLFGDLSCHCRPSTVRHCHTDVSMIQRYDAAGLLLLLRAPTPCMANPVALCKGPSAKVKGTHTSLHKVS